MHFRGEDVKSLVSNFVPPLELILVPEPENQYDSMAIKVFYNETHIGYIGRPDNGFVFLHLEDERPYSCVVTHMEPRGNNLHPICTVTFS